MDTAPVAAGAPALFEEETLTRGELLRFVYTCPQAMLMTAKDGGVRLLSAGAVSLLIPFSHDGSLDNLFALLDPYEPRLRELLRGAVLGPSRRLEGYRIEMAPGRDGERSSWIEISAVVFDDGYSFTCHDVSAVVEREQRYRAVAAEEAHQRGKIESATAILHDLGNALTGIGSRAVEVRRQIDDASVEQNLGRVTGLLRPTADRLDAVIGAAGRGRALVDLLSSMADATARTRALSLASLEKITLFLTHAQELLAIHRAYAGPGSGASQGRSGVDRILADVRSMMADPVEKRGGTIAVAPATALHVRADRSKLMQVVLNLVKNAAEAFDELPPEHPRQVALSAAPDLSGGLVISVRDTGPGFPAELGPRLFEDGHSTKQRGSGVGLAACRRIVESLGGALTLTSEGPGAGALAQIVFPRGVVAHDPN